MQIFKTKEMVEYYFSEHPLGFEMAKQLFQSVKQIEELNNSGFQDMKACVILTDSDKELELIYKRYGLSDTTPKLRFYRQRLCLLYRQYS